MAAEGPRPSSYAHVMPVVLLGQHVLDVEFFHGTPLEEPDFVLWTVAGEHGRQAGGSDRDRFVDYSLLQLSSKPAWSGRGGGTGEVEAHKERLVKWIGECYLRHKEAIVENQLLVYSELLSFEYGAYLKDRGSGASKVQCLVRPQDSGGALVVVVIPLLVEEETTLVRRFNTLVRGFLEASRWPVEDVCAISAVRFSLRLTLSVPTRSALTVVSEEVRLDMDEVGHPGAHTVISFIRSCMNLTEVPRYAHGNHLMDFIPLVETHLLSRTTCEAQHFLELVHMLEPTLGEPLEINIARPRRAPIAPGSATAADPPCKTALFVVADDRTEFGVSALVKHTSGTAPRVVLVACQFAARGADTPIVYEVQLPERALGDPSGTDVMFDPKAAAAELSRAVALGVAKCAKLCA